MVGLYEIGLTVNDDFADSAQDVVIVSVATAGDYATQQIVNALNIIASLPPSSVTTTGNQNALTNFLSSAIDQINKGNTSQAIKKLEDAIERLDGCALRGTPDVSGGGNKPAKDYVIDSGDPTNCAVQAVPYALLNNALGALMQ